MTLALPCFHKQRACAAAADGTCRYPADREELDVGVARNCPAPELACLAAARATGYLLPGPTFPTLTGAPRGVRIQTFLRFRGAQSDVIIAATRR